MNWGKSGEDSRSSLCTRVEIFSDSLPSPPSKSFHTVLHKRAQLSSSFENHYQVFSKLLSFHCCHSMKRKLTTMSRQLGCLATEGHVLILTCFWSWLMESDYVKPVRRVVCHLWNANKTTLLSKVPGVIDVKIYSNIIHFPLCFSGMDVISFHALLNAL